MFNISEMKKDFYQRFNIITTILLDLYCSITCSLLIVFIPQKCNDHICSINENLTWRYTFYNISLIINFITLFSFFPLYILEILRENKLIKYLDVNPNISNNNDDIGINEKNKILQIDKYYKYYFYIIIIIYLINVICSFITINENYINNTTSTTFITYIICMYTKLSNVYIIVNTKENIFYSAYMKSNVQFNDNKLPKVLIYD